MRLLLGDMIVQVILVIDDGEHSAVGLVEVKKTLVRRSIELGFIKDVNSLVVSLSQNLYSAFILNGILEATVTLFPLPAISSPTPLIKAKAAFSFVIHSSQLLVVCRQKVVLYSWKDGEPQEVKVRF